MTTRRMKLGVAATALAAGAFGLAAPAVAAPAPAPSAPSAAAAACDRTPWEPTVQGAPKGFGAGSPSGDYLWHDTAGFHLRVTHPHHDARVYSGEIVSSAPMRVDPVKLEKGDILRLSADHRALVFVFADHGYIDGANFHTDCAGTLSVRDLRIGNANLPRGDVYLGATRAHPAAIPFTVHRLPVRAA